MEGDPQTFCATIKPVPCHQPSEPQHLFDNSCSGEISYLPRHYTNAQDDQQKLNKSSRFFFFE